MNSINKHEKRIQHTLSFTSVHPPGGLVAWPNGRTTRIRNRRTVQAIESGRQVERKAFVAWPEEGLICMRA